MWDVSLTVQVTQILEESVLRVQEADVSQSEDIAGQEKGSDHWINIHWNCIIWGLPLAILVFRCEGITQMESVCEQSGKENTYTQRGESKRKTEKNTWSFTLRICYEYRNKPNM
jgi:hypothetical protein